MITYHRTICHKATFVPDTASLTYLSRIYLPTCIYATDTNSYKTDSIIPTRGGEHYYRAVMKLDPAVHGYYRLFLAPGINHCFGGAGAFPDTAFDAPREWVENGVAPDTQGLLVLEEHRPYSGLSVFTHRSSIITALGVLPL